MNRKIRYIIFIFAFQMFHISLYSQGTWESVESPTNQFLRSVDFVDSLYGWAVGDSGTIIHTTNGGADWVFQNSKTENNIVDVFFLNRNMGWASSWNTSIVPFGTLLLKTADGGQSWTSESYQDNNIFVTTILFLDSLNGWMGGTPHALVKTTNGGMSWVQADIDTSLFAFFPVLYITFYNSQYGYACGGWIDGAGVVWSTTNGGDNWFAINPSEAPPDPINQVHTFDSLNVIGIGGDREVFGIGVIRTSDGGSFWEYKDIGMPGFGLTLDFRTENEVWCTLSAQQKFIYSLDTGATWLISPIPDSSFIFDVIFPDSLHGFAVGKQGAILKYKPPIVDAVITQDDLVPEIFILEQNYPNPFNPTTKIKFTIPQFPLLGGDGRGGLITLKVYDVLGNDVATLVNDAKPPGKYEVEWNASDYPSGVYFYQLKKEGYIETKKMIILK